LETFGRDLKSAFVFGLGILDDRSVCSSNLFSRVIRFGLLFEDAAVGLGSSVSPGRTTEMFEMVDVQAVVALVKSGRAR
jgi:hypothetical protein